MRVPFACLTLLLALSACQSSQPARRPAPHRPAPARPVPPSEPAPQPTAGAEGIAWLESERLMPVLELAQRQKKPVFVEFNAVWCAPCKVMEEEVFSQPAAYEYVNSHFLAFRTDFDSPSGKNIAQVYEVKSLPTVLFLDPQGVVLQRKTGMLTLSTLKALGDAALGRR
ncbi:MAG TPA: thioredoxin family protein [Saprospiraceae bacterium]|nr:thioredoxin family protein [Saprospiraceae bacterium]HND87978.1 thioredoxin family protein [Saprospiraceae bacterium]HNG89642.1 thioredoxin family protein [Saprospiraceae bacterium]